MNIFNKHKNQQLLEKTINPLIMEGFFNQIKDIICIANYDGTIDVINNAEINEKYTTLMDFFSETENKDLYDNIMNKIKVEGCYINDIEIYKDNKIVRLYIAAYQINAVQKIFFYIKDINKYFEKEIELLEKLDQQDEYLKSKDLFIANLSHEIRTPINTIVGMIYFLKNTGLDQSQLEYVTKLEDASNLLLEMVNGILDLSGSKNYSLVNSKTDFNFKKFITGITDMLTEKLNKKELKLYLNLKFDDSTNISVDKARLSQLFINLIENAIKYTDKGYIEIDGKKLEENNVCYKFQFCIKDTGIGIKKEDTLRIFQEFQQVGDPTRKTKDGKGMGLAIAKKIVEDMNGKMWVESSIGLGSKFYFTLVLDKSNKKTEDLIENEFIEPKIIIEENKTNTHLSDEKRILLVEDNQLNIEITKKILEEINYVCDVSIDGIAAIKQIKEKGINYYNLILMDIHMPKYNGYEISKILKKDLDVKIPIVALTATSITPEIIKENANYISDYIQKPIQPTEFKEKIKGYLETNTTIEKTIKRNLLLIGEKDTHLTNLKHHLQNNFSVAITKSELDAKILLESGNVDAIIIDEFDDIEKEFELINNIKQNSTSTIILINRNANSNLRDKAFYHGITNIIYQSELLKCEIAIGNILNQTNKESSLEQNLEKAKDEIENVYNFLFESMVNLTTSKSKETGQHLKRTQQFMKIMLRKYEEFYKENKFTSNEIIEDISMAAVLHDIGKVGIPDDVLNKPGRLTDEEYEIIKTHVIIGKNILETTYGNKVSNNILNYAKDIVYHHHEKFDGSGYPEHLKGDEISVISRIMALIDVYDALANERIYKPAMPYEDVENLIINESGKSFDPKIVNIFKMVKDEIKSVNEANKDIKV